MSGLRLEGTEEWTVELSGAIAASEVVVPGIELIERDEEVEVGLLVFSMRRLRPRGLPGPGSNYREALWRLAARVDGVPGWLAHTCDLDRALVRWLGRRLIRYPARAASIEMREQEPRWQLDVRAGSERLQVTVELSDEAPEPTLPRPVLVLDGARTKGVPWAEDAAPFRRRARVVDVHDSLSPATLGAAVRWDSSALVHRGRTHHCGFATARTR